MPSLYFIIFNYWNWFSSVNPRSSMIHVNNLKQHVINLTQDTLGQGRKIHPFILQSLKKKHDHQVSAILTPTEQDPRINWIAFSFGTLHFSSNFLHFHAVINVTKGYRAQYWASRLPGHFSQLRSAIMMWLRQFLKEINGTLLG